MRASITSSLPRGGVKSSFTVALLAAPLLAACGGSTTTPAWPKGNVVFHDENNYTSTSTLTIPVVQTGSGVDLSACWTGLQKDLLCHNIEAGNAIDNVGFAKIPNQTHDQVAASLAIGQFDDNLAQVYGDYNTVKAAAGTTCAMLSEFQLGDKTVAPATDFVEPAAGKTVTYLLVFTTGTTPAVGVKSMAFLEPMVSSTVTSVTAFDACASNVLSFQATLGQAMEISATDSSKWYVDWSQITKDSFGTKVDLGRLKVDKVLIGFYQGKTAADLQTNFKDIEQDATTLYEVPVPMGGRAVHLADAKQRGTSTPFPGFGDHLTDGVWALAVQCGKCQLPAPVMLSILTPQP